VRRQRATYLFVLMESSTPCCPVRKAVIARAQFGFAGREVFVKLGLAVQRTYIRSTAGEIIQDAMDRVRFKHATPHGVRFDNGPDFPADAVSDWADSPAPVHFSSILARCGTMPGSSRSPAASVADCSTRGALRRCCAKSAWSSTTCAAITLSSRAATVLSLGPIRPTANSPLTELALQWATTRQPEPQRGPPKVPPLSPPRLNTVMDAIVQRECEIGIRWWHTPASNPSGGKWRSVDRLIPSLRARLL
jgi:hypothetical protein